MRRIYQLIGVLFLLICVSRCSKDDIPAKSPAKQITAFSFDQITPKGTGTIDQSALTISVTVVYGTDLSALVPTITLSPGATVSPDSGVASDFSTPVAYTVTAADGSEQTYAVTVNVSTASAKVITSFSFTGPSLSVTATIDKSNNTISASVPYATNVTALVPTISIAGASVSPASGISQNFTAPVVYTVTALDGSKQQYTVSVTVARLKPSDIFWFGTGPYTTGEFNCVAKIPDAILFGTNIGVFRTWDKGLTWDQLTLGLMNTSVNALAVQPSSINPDFHIIYAGTSGGVFKSVDKGDSWTALSDGLTDKTVLSLVVSGGRVFAGTLTGGVFTLPDNGTTWTQVKNGLPGKPINCLAMNGSTLFAGTDGAGVFKSDSNGSTWTAFGLANTDVSFMTTIGNAMFVSTTTGTYRSADSGATWTAILPGNYVSSIGATPTSLYASTYGGSVYKSKDNGVTWTMNYVTTVPINCLIADSYSVFFGTLGSMDYTVNDAVTWHSSPFYTITAVSIKGIVSQGENIFAAGGGGVFVSNNNTITWTEVNNGLGSNLAITSLIASGGNNILVGTTNAGSYYTDNNGSTWHQTKGFNSPNPPFKCLARGGGGFVYGGGGQGIARSSDNGVNWVTNTLDTSEGEVRAFFVDANDNFYAAGDGLFFSSTGIGWSKITTSRFLSVASVGTYVYGGGGSYMAVSRDSGQHWESYRVVKGDIAVDIKSIAITGGNVFAATDGAGVFLSSDNGQTWTAVNTGLDVGDGALNVNYITIIGNSLYIGTELGVFQSRL